MAGSIVNERVLILDEKPPKAKPANKTKENLGKFRRPKNKQY
jgi:hypothetical protein